MQLRKLVLTLCAIGAFAISVHGWRLGRSEPVVHQARLAAADWPTGAPLVRIVLLADLHLGNSSTDPARLERIVSQVTDLEADLILIAGDFVANYGFGGVQHEAAELEHNLSKLRARYGTVAVMGNHDNLSAPRLIAKALERAGVTVLENSAVRRGPLIIGGAGDTVSGRAHFRGMFAQMQQLATEMPGARVYLSHSPDAVRWLPPGRALLFAGHTHCGQASLPFVGPLMRVSRIYGNRFRCGLTRFGMKTIIVSGGIGTTYVPMRIGVPPDIWLISIGPAGQPKVGRKERPATDQ